MVRSVIGKAQGNQGGTTGDRVLTVAALEMVERGQFVQYISFRNANKTELALTFKPRGDVARNPKQGYPWLLNSTCEYVRQKKKEEKKRAIRIISYLVLSTHCCCNKFS